MARPRDPSFERRILDTFGELAERDGIANVSIAGIAAESGISRAAIYRRWPSRAALVFEAQTTRSVAGGFPDRGSTRDEFVDAMVRLVVSMATGDRELTASMLGQMITTEDFADGVWTNRWGPDIDAMYEMWERAVERGDVDRSVDGRAVMEDMVAVCIMQVMLSHREFGVDAVGEWVDRLLAGLSPRP